MMMMMVYINAFETNGLTLYGAGGLLLYAVCVGPHWGVPSTGALTALDRTGRNSVHI